MRYLSNKIIMDLSSSRGKPIEILNTVLAGQSSWFIIARNLNIHVGDTRYSGPKASSVGAQPPAPEL